MAAKYEKHPMEEKFEKDVIEISTMEKEQKECFDVFMGDVFTEEAGFPFRAHFSRADMELAFKNGWATGVYKAFRRCQFCRHWKVVDRFVGDCEVRKDITHRSGECSEWKGDGI